MGETQHEPLKEITKQLEQGIRDVFEGEKYRQYLNTMSKFHAYSYRNSLLISMQCPEASLVAGYQAWERNFDRHPVRGAKAIKIIAPCPRTVEHLVPEVHPQTKQPILGNDGQPVYQKVKQIIPAYRVVNVFDVSQTVGKEIAGLDFVQNLTGDVQQFKDYIAALRYAAPVGIRFEQLPDETKGYYDSGEKRIVIQKGMSQAQTVKTIIHEIAHGKLHDRDFGTETRNAPDRKTKEVQAESVAYTVCQHYGLDTSDYSFAYIASWSSNKQLDELESSLAAIRDTSAEIIQAVDHRLDEISQEREQQLHPPLAKKVGGVEQNGKSPVREPVRAQGRIRR